MSSCLGLYIEPNLIKYAKISKDRDVVKVDSFGIKFYDKIGDAIKQIISETYSHKTPISINLSEETYRYFYMFNLLKKNDLKKAIDTEFESLCTDKGINKNALEARYALVNSEDDKEKVKVIHVSTSKIEINNINQKFAEYRVSNITPMGLSIANVANLKAKENVLIVNMEEKTTITTITKQKVYNVETIDEGAKTVLDSISVKENSYSKAYDICKNSTIYTMEGKELQDEENEYLEYIMPTLYQIANKVKEVISKSTMRIDRVYLTGTLSVVNNIDLYFQEVLSNEKCELMKPFFIKDSIKISIKDYIETNSAIALALQGLDYGIKDINFQQMDWKSELTNIFANLKVEPNKKEKEKTNKSSKSKLNINVDFKKFFSLNLKEKLDNTEKWLLRTSGAILAVVLLYSGFSLYLNHQIIAKNNEITEVKNDTTKQISMVESDVAKVNQKTNEYKELAAKLKNISAQITENNKYKKAIPNFLTELTNSIPKGVQITSIENTNGKHITISAQSNQYEQLGIFEAIIRVQGILVPDTVKSSSAIKQGSTIQVRIEGDLI